jgi:hypothetical protein
MAALTGRFLAGACEPSPDRIDFLAAVCPKLPITRRLAMKCVPTRGFLYLFLAACGGLGILASTLVAEPQSAEHAAPALPPDANTPARQAVLEAGLAKMLSGATLEGSFTRTGAGSESDKLSREKYTLGEVKKVAGDMWQMPARIQYGDKDVTLPIMLPIRWAGDTPVAIVDLSLPGFGAVSARVMFFDDHYAGYWKHGAHSGSMFGVIHRAKAIAPTPNASRTVPGESTPALMRQGVNPANVK